MQWMIAHVQVEFEIFCEGFLISFQKVDLRPELVGSILVYPIEIKNTSFLKGSSSDN